MLKTYMYDFPIVGNTCGTCNSLKETLMELELATHVLVNETMYGS